MALDPQLTSLIVPPDEIARIEEVLNRLVEETGGNHALLLDKSGQVIACHGDASRQDTTALGALIGFARRAREKGGDLKLAHLPAKIFNIVDLLGFNKILDVCDSVKDAEARFQTAGS